MCDYSGGLHWIFDFFHLYTRLVITSNYSVTANLHNLQINTAPVKTFLACCVFSRRSLATAFKSKISSSSCAQVSFKSFGSGVTELRAKLDADMLLDFDISRMQNETRSRKCKLFTARCHVAD
jgi:hypothetical protein